MFILREENLLEYTSKATSHKKHRVLRLVSLFYITVILKIEFGECKHV